MIAQAGVALADIPAVLETVSKASVATGSNAETVFNGLSSAASAYGISVQNLLPVSDLFFQANADGKLSIEGLANAIGTVAPIANTAGVSLQELIAGFSTMVGTTGNADEVATQLKGAIQALVAPSAEATVTARQLGIELGAQAVQTKGYVGVIKDIYEKTNGNLVKIKEIIPEVRALTAVTYLGSQGNELYAKNLDSLGNSLGATEKAFDTYTESEVGAIKRSEQTWNNWKTNIGSVFVLFGAYLINGVAWLDRFVTMSRDFLTIGISVFALAFSAIIDTVIGAILFIVKNWSTFGINMAKIAENLGYNIGQAFDSIPDLIATALSLALKKVEEFFASSIKKYNEFVEFIGQSQLKITTNISSGGVSGSDNK